MSARYRRLFKRPIAGRFSVIWSVCLVGSLLSLAVESQAEPLTLQQTLASVERRPELKQWLDSSVEAQRAAGEQRALWPNPKLAYEREQLLGDGSNWEEGLTLSQRFDVSGKRGLSQEASHWRAQSLQADGQQQRLDLRHEVRRAFYELLYLQQRFETRAKWLRRLSKMAKTMEQRAAAGEVSRYASQRLSQELKRAETSQLAVEMEREAAWLKLQTWLGTSNVAAAREWPRVVGQLLPNEIPSSAPANEAPAVQALELEARAAGAEAEAADRAWVPEFELSGGWKRAVGNGQDRHGFRIGLAIDLPLFDRGQGNATQARATRRANQGRATWIRQQWEGETQHWKARLKYSREVLAELRADSERSAQLVEVAEAAYAGGELSILELLDAYRGASEDELRTLELELAVRLAWLQQRRLTGGQEP